MRPYVTLVKPIPGDPIDELLRLAYNEQDASLLFSRNASYAQILSCASKKYYAGELSQLTFECIFARLIIGLTVALVIGVLFVRIFMAMWFSWFMASQLSRTPDVNKLKAQGEPFFK